MVKKRREQERIDEAVSLGRENARLYRKVKNWCRHLEIEMLSSGMLAELYRLPIGRMSITCEHASGPSVQAMQLHHVATSFILNNCRDCPFHETVDIDNIGAVIFNEADRLKEEREESSEQGEGEKHDALKLELLELISGDLHEALDEAEITEQSILKLVALLDDETHHIDAGKKLEQASEVAPDLFTDLAVEILCSNFPDVDHGSYCIRSARNLAKGERNIPPFATMAAERCLGAGRNADEVCGLMGDLVAYCGYKPTPETVDKVIGVQWHGHVVGSATPLHRDYPGSRHALQEIGLRWAESIEDSIRKRLTINDKRTRISAAHVLVSLLDHLPSIGTALIDPLIDSLELDDDHYEDSADAAACQAIATIYVRDPEMAQQRMEAGYRRCSAEAQALLYSVYRYIAVGRRWFSLESEESAPLYEECAPKIISPVLQAIAGLGYSLEVKDSATGALEAVARDSSRALLPHLDTLIGTLANLTQEQVLLSQKTAKDPLTSLEKQSQQSQLRAIVRRVAGALIAVANVEPRAVLTRVKEILPRLDSSNPQQARLKAELAKVYPRLATEHDLLPEVVPDLYKLLTDFDSAIVRGTAVQAVGEILQHRADALPDNMLEMVVIYLNDTYVYVHKTATRAVRFIKPLRLEQATEIALRLLALDQAYQDEPYFRREILRSILHVTRSFTDLLESLTAPLILTHARLEDQYIAEDALVDFDRIRPLLPERYAPIFAIEVIQHLGRCRRDRYNDERYPDRHRLYSSLFDLPRQAIAQCLEAAKATALRLSEEDPWDALKMVRLLTYFEFHEEAAELANLIANEQPKTKRYEGIIRECVLEGSLAAAEALVAKGKQRAAAEVLEEAISLEAERHEQDKGERLDDVIDAFAVADRVARQLRLV